MKMRFRWVKGKEIINSLDFYLLDDVIPEGMIHGRLWSFDKKWSGLGKQWIRCGKNKNGTSIGERTRNYKFLIILSVLRDTRGNDLKNFHRKLRSVLRSKWSRGWTFLTKKLSMTKKFSYFTKDSLCQRNSNWSRKKRFALLVYNDISLNNDSKAVHSISTMQSP